MNNEDLKASYENFKKEHNKRTKELIDECINIISDLEFKILTLKDCSSFSESCKDCYVDFLESSVEFYKKLIDKSLIY